MLKYILAAFLLLTTPAMAGDGPTLEEVRQSGVALAGDLSGIVITLQAKLSAATREIEAMKKMHAETPAAPAN